MVDAVFLFYLSIFIVAYFCPDAVQLSKGHFTNPIDWLNPGSDAAATLGKRVSARSLQYNEVELRICWGGGKVRGASLWGGKMRGMVRGRLWLVGG